MWLNSEYDVEVVDAARFLLAIAMLAAE